MKTGEGKTLVATLPAYLNALTGQGVHIITVNDYLAKRDAEWMGQIYQFLGLSVGTVLHGFLGEKIEDIKTCKKLVKKISENYHLPYFTLTPTFSICPEHGYISGEQFKCPKCKKETEVWSRIVGYLRPVNAWNPGKQAEYGERKEFQVQ